jgi:hypothetical protein
MNECDICRSEKWRSMSFPMAVRKFDTSISPQRSPRWKPLGEILVERGLITPLQLQAALNEQVTRGGRLGEILFEHGLVSAVDLRDALAEQHGLDLRVEARAGSEPSGEPKRDSLPLGHLLIRRGQITEAQLNDALAEQERTGCPLGQILVASRVISVFTLAAALAEQQGVAAEPEKAWEAAQFESDRGPSLYELREIVDGTSRRLYAGNSFIDTTDVAFAILQELDPNRLVVVEVDGDSDARLCWEYPAANGAGESRP